MLDLIKVQGQTRIKNDFDKRMIRKLNVEQTAQLGFVSPQQRQQSEKQKLYKDNLKQSAEIHQRMQTTSDSQSDYDDNDEDEETQDNKRYSLNFTTSNKNRQSEKTIRNNSEVISLPKNQKKTEFQKQMDSIVQKANKTGEKSAKISYTTKKTLLQEIQTESQKLILNYSESTKSLGNQKKAPFLPCLNLNTTNHMLQNYPTHKFHNIQEERSLDENGVNHSKQTGFLNNSQQLPTYLKKNASQGDITQKGSKPNYSKQMTYLMDLTLQEAVNSKQSQIARKLMNIEDSAIVQQYKQKMDQIKIYQEQKKQLASLTPSPQKKFLTAEILQQLEGTSFAPKMKSFFPLPAQ